MNNGSKELKQNSPNSLDSILHLLAIDSILINGSNIPIMEVHANVQTSFSAARGNSKNVFAILFQPR